MSSGKQPADETQVPEQVDATLQADQLALDEALDPNLVSATAIGIDAGATLVKVCVLDPADTLHFATWSSPARDAALALID